MGQINVGLGVHSTPTTGTCGYGFSAQGKPVYIDAIGVAHELYSDVSVDGVSANILANLGVGLEADIPVASAGFTYVTSDTFKIYQGVDMGVYDISDLTSGQFVTDTYAVEHKTYQFIGTELMPVSGGGSTVTICDQAGIPCSPVRAFRLRIRTHIGSHSVSLSVCEACARCISPTEVCCHCLVRRAYRI